MESSGLYRVAAIRRDKVAFPLRLVGKSLAGWFESGKFGHSRVESEDLDDIRIKRSQMCGSTSKLVKAGETMEATSISLTAEYFFPDSAMVG